MDEPSKKSVVILIGPPGSGKDTQAEYLAKELGLVHVKTSGLIEEKFKTADSNDPQIIEEKRRWTEGELVGREFVNKLMLEKIKDVRESEKGIIFSGSPREATEAKVIMPELDSLFGKDNIKVVKITLSEEESIKRNSHRRMCEANRHPIPDFPEFKDITVCPEDGSPIVTRVLDDPETIKIRYKVYLNETEPVIDFLREKGYNILEVDGEQSIENLHRDILNKLW